MTSRARVSIATSLDGSVAGPDDDLARLTEPDAAQRGRSHGRAWSGRSSAERRPSASPQVTGRFFHTPSSSYHV